MNLNCGRADEMWGSVRRKKNKKLGLARGGLTTVVAVLCDQAGRQADRSPRQVDRKMNK